MARAKKDDKGPSTSRNNQDVPADPAAALKSLRVFRDLSPAEVGDLAASATILRIPQDRIVPRGQEGKEEPAFLFVLKGKVAFAEFAQGTIPGPPSPKRRVVPTMQVAHRIVALFEEGDFFANDHVPHARSEDGVKRDMALFTCLHSELLRIPSRKMQEALGKFPALQASVDVVAQASYYRQEYLKLEGRAKIFDFYVRQGFEYAKAIKILQSDKCIDCDECVKACESRHGVARIERFGPRLGMVQFTLNCRTCTDARCIDVCAFDAIGYDQESEVIVYDNCVGCTKCAKACPHEAIRMIDIKDDVSSAKGDAAPAAPRKEGTRIAKGEEAAPRKKAKRLANKCDHCFGFEDMACITACPTAAIIQIDPRDLFRRDEGSLERVDRYFDSLPFEEGYSEAAKAQGVRAMHAVFAVVSAAVVACVFEFVARKTDPSLSLWSALVGAMHGARAASDLVLSTAAASGMGRWMGYLGALMMIISALYTLRLRAPLLRRVGSAKTWFDFHVVFGIAGPVLSLLHTDLHVFDLTKWLQTALWWSVAAIVVSGFVGRFLYTQIPKFETTTDREKKRLDEGIQQVADQWASMTVSANVLAQFLKAQEKTEDRRTADARGGVLMFLLRLLTGWVGRTTAMWALRFRTMKTMRNTKLRDTTLRLMRRRAVIDGRVQFYGIAKGLLATWRGIHIGLSIVMFVLLSAHVAISVWAVGW